MSESRWIAVLSDTHGVLPQFVVDELKSRNIIHIFHAGDVCSPDIPAALRLYAPLTLVRGNMDGIQAGAKTELVDVAGFLFYLLHNLYDLDIDPVATGVAAVIHGHLHEPSIEWKNRVLYLNTGSCAWPRGDHGSSLALIEIRDDSLQPEIIYQKSPAD